MSAFQCTDEHISALAGYAARHGLCRAVNPDPRRMTDAEFIGALLHKANLASLHARYGGKADDISEPLFRFDARAAERVLHASPVAIIKAAQCFNYQACEVDDYEKTAAAECMRFVISNAIHELPGYNDAAWGSPLPAVSAVPSARRAG